MCSAFRTPICRAKRGGFKDTFPDDLLAPVLKVQCSSSYLFKFSQILLRSTSGLALHIAYILSQFPPLPPILPLILSELAGFELVQPHLSLHEYTLLNLN